MITKDQFTTGDIFFVLKDKDDKLIPKTTFMFEQFENWKKGSPVKLKEIAVHVGGFVRDGNIEHIAEGNFPEFEYVKWPGRYTEKELLENCIWKTPVKPLDIHEQLYFKEMCKYYNGSPYDVMGYINQGPKILFGIWLGKRGKKAERRVTCSEFFPTVMNHILKEKPFKKSWRIDPLELYIHPYYKKLV